MNFKTLSLLAALSAGLFACDDGGSDCESTCSVVGVTCAGDVVTSCTENADSCLIETVQDCGAAGQTCDAAAAEPVCSSTCTDDPACDGASDGIGLCSGDEAVTCSMGADGCLDATAVDCTATSEVCDEFAGTSTCTAACEDHPLCVGAADEDLTCDGYNLNSCAVNSLGCLDFEQSHCGSTLCDATLTPIDCASAAATGLNCATALPVEASGFFIRGADFVADFAGGINLTSTDGCNPTADVATVGMALEVDLLDGETMQVYQTGDLPTIISLQAGSCTASDACTASVALDENFLEYTASGAETVFVIVESNEVAPTDTDYSIHVFFGSECGNGQFDPGESCDDGNLDDGDGCSATCAPEFGYGCDSFSPSTCTAHRSIGSFGSGDIIPSVSRPAAATEGAREFFMITFTEDVELSGSVVAAGTGDYDFYIVDNEERDVVLQVEIGDEHWSGRLIPAGTYMLETELWDDSDLGYTLSMSTTDSSKTVGVGETVAEVGEAIEEDSSLYLVYTFTDDVMLTGTLTGTTDSDLDLFISGTDGPVTASIEDGDETFVLALYAGTYSFRVSAYFETASFNLDFATTALSLSGLGTFAAGDAITDVVGSVIANGAHDHYEIEFSEAVLITGTLDGATTGGPGILIYDATESYIFDPSFVNVELAAGKYMVQIRTDAFADPVDAYNLALSTTAVPL